MSDMPRLIMRNCTIFTDQTSQIGQAKEMTLPVPTEKMEELRNAGMVMPIDVPMGFEKLEAGFKLTSFDPSVISLFGLEIGVEKNFMITGALVSEDGTVASAVATISGRLNKQDAGSWSPGEMAESDFGISVRSYRLEVDGKVIVEMTPFDVSINGVSQTAKIRQALMA